MKQYNKKRIILIVLSVIIVMLSIVIQTSVLASESNGKSSITTSITTTKKVESTTSKVNCTHSGVSTGNCGKWYSSYDAFMSDYNATSDKYNNMWLNDEITSEEYYSKSPSGYNVWKCGQCGKWTGDYHYREETTTQKSTTSTTKKETTTKKPTTSSTTIEDTTTTTEKVVTTEPDISICEHIWNFVTYTQGTHLKYCKKCYEMEYVECKYSKIVVEPVGNEKGYITYTCIDCGYSYNANYIYSIEQSSEPTTEIPKTTHKHSWNDGVITKEATCNKEGTITYTCTSCGATITETVNATGKHSYIADVKAPTCKEQGYTVYTCSKCGNSYVTDYTMTLKHNYIYETIGKGTHKIKCQNCGLENVEYCNKAKKITYTKKATTSKNGCIVTICSICSVIQSDIPIYYPKTITLSTASYTYDGKAKKPNVIVKDANGKIVSASNYTLNYASGRKNVGKYSVKVTFKNNYSGSKTLYFVINPKGTTIQKITALSKAFTVYCNKQPTQTTGYQIQYSTSNNFQNAKSVTIKNPTTSKKINKLSGKKKYYVRIRTYKNVNGTNYYSSWSSVKTITTKK